MNPHSFTSGKASLHLSADRMPGVSCYTTQSVSAKNYHTFGVPLLGRNFSVEGYRFTFNGMEKTDEVYGGGNEYSTEYRQYDPRIGRWLSIDHLFKNFPWQSPYAAFDNNPILIKDPKGLAGESSTGNPDKKIERQNRRFERLKSRLSDKHGEGTDKFNSELARIGSRARYGSNISYRQGYESPATKRNNTGSTNSDFVVTSDNTKSTYQEGSILGAQSGTIAPYPLPGALAGEVSFDVTVTDGQEIFLKAATYSGYQVNVEINGVPLSPMFSPAQQPAYDPNNPDAARHIRVSEYKSLAISTGSSTPQIVTITFKTVFTPDGAAVHRAAYPIPTNTAIISIGTLKR